MGDFLIRRRAFLVSALLSVSASAMAGGAVTSSRERRSANLIRAVQTALTERGFDAGTLDGLMGPRTRAAIRSFQSAEDLPVTGAIDTSLLIALGLRSSS